MPAHPNAILFLNLIFRQGENFMCGIIGVMSYQNVSEAIIEGLKRLEYRGYDSAGLATVHEGKIARLRSEGKIINLEDKLKNNPVKGSTGIGHTRWATHGKPCEKNAHPHANDDVAVVHNGIIENYLEIKKKLETKGFTFHTDTDTEVVIHLVSDFMRKCFSIKDAAFRSLEKLEGAFAIVMIFAGEENLLVGARQGTPLAVGYGEDEIFMASDSYALAPMTRRICFLEDGDRVAVSKENVEITDQDGNPVERKIRMTAQSGATTGKGEYRHFMQKEIYEQPAVIGDTLNSFIHPSTGHVSMPENIVEKIATTPRITLIACGTAFYSCMIAKYWFENLARIPCEVDIASEFRYREAPLPKNGISVFVSQSGETLDTLEALRYCKSNGQAILSIVNTVESTIERESDFVLHTLAGPEIGVASTKAFTTQLTTLACLALAVSFRKNVISNEEEKEYTDALRHVPHAVSQILEHDANIRQIAHEVFEVQDILYLARGSLYPLALEGALKLKEISYIHAEGYAAGELKHGPIALIDEHVPVVVIAPSGMPLFEKMVSNIQETYARGGLILLLTDSGGAEILNEQSRWIVELDTVHSFVAPIVYTIPVQLLAYHVAVWKGTDVDQPRNLAKSVTVE